MFLFSATVCCVHQGNSAVQLVGINPVVNVKVDGTVFGVHGHQNLYNLVIVHLIPHLAFVQIQQLVENVNLGSTVLLDHPNQYHAKQVLLPPLMVLFRVVSVCYSNKETLFGMSDTLSM